MQPLQVPSCWLRCRQSKIRKPVYVRRQASSAALRCCGLETRGDQEDGKLLPREAETRPLISPSIVKVFLERLGITRTYNEAGGRIMRSFTRGAARGYVAPALSSYDTSGAGCIASGSDLSAAMHRRLVCGVEGLLLKMRPTANRGSAEPSARPGKPRTRFPQLVFTFGVQYDWLLMRPNN